MLGKRKWSEDNPLTSIGLVMGVGAAAVFQVWHTRRFESSQEVQCLEASQEVQCLEASQEVQCLEASQEVQCLEASQEVQCLEASQEVQCLEASQEVQCLEASQEVQCCLCNEKSATWFNLPCSHGGYCQGCLQKAERDRKKTPNCQQCGKKIVGVIDDNLGDIRSHD